MHLLIAHVLVEHADDGGRMKIGDVVLHMAESLYVLVQGFAVSLRDHVQVTCLSRSYVAACEGTNKLVAQVRPRSNRIYRQMHQP